MTALVLASSNPGKLREFAALLAPLRLELLAQGSLGIPAPAETGSSFLANAVLKGEFKCLPLRLLGTLLGLSLKACDLFLQLRYGVLAVLHSQVKVCVRLTESISASLLEPSSDSLLQVEGEFAFLVPKLLFFP